MFDIPCVISNHEDLRGYDQWHGIPCFYVPVAKQHKQPHFKSVSRALAEAMQEVVVLARGRCFHLEGESAHGNKTVVFA
jgi:formyltetrahydrofolate deformylase